MLFNSLEFVLFFAAVYPLYLVANRRAQNLLLLAASYIFYAAWDWRFLSLIGLSTIVDYYCGKNVGSRGKAGRRYLLISLITNLSLLGFFKYFNWFAESLVTLLKSMGFAPSAPTLHVLLPVGISFYTFQTLSYTIDVYRKKLDPVDDFLDFALFVAFFPQLVAGPIERAKHLLPQLMKERSIRIEDVHKGAWLIAFGYFMKVFVADNLAPTVNATYALGAEPGSSEIVFGTYAFAFQIFGDFAGYSSIAIGLTRLMGMDLMTNFLYPYFVTNPQDFWRNWHISLSTWLRDYLYIGLGGSRHGSLRTYRNLFLTMLLGGIWHGAAWTFVAWGVYQGGVLIAHRLLSPVLARASPRGPMASRLTRLFLVIVMFQITCYGWIIFRAQSMGQLMDMTVGILTGPWTLTSTAVSQLKQLLFYATPLMLLQFLQYRRNDPYAVLKLGAGVQSLIFVLLFFAVLVWGNLGAHEFIYFQF